MHVEPRPYSLAPQCVHISGQREQPICPIKSPKLNLLDVKSVLLILNLLDVKSVLVYYN